VPPGEYQVTAMVDCYLDSDDIYSDPLTITIGEQQQTIPLYAGWNFVSLNLDPVFADPYIVFESVWQYCNSIWAYDAVSGTWLYYNFIDLDCPNTLTDVEPDWGYWVDMAADATLVIFGEPLEDTSIELVRGYNVVAFESADELLLEDALPIEYVSIWTLDNLTGEWLKNVQWGSPSTNNLIWLVPGNAYYIDVIYGCTWDVGSPGF